MLHIRLRFILALIASMVTAAHGSPEIDPWDDLRQLLVSWESLGFDANFGVNVGDASGPLFTYASKNFSMTNTTMDGASLSKWPSAVMISNIVADPNVDLHFDDLANKHLSWWTKDVNDTRSSVTLRQLLSFTSGYTSDPVALYTCKRDFMECAKRIYDSAKYYVKPGTTWAYLGIHLQLAGAVGVAATNLPIEKLFEKYLYTPFGMTKTYWGPDPQNPSMAGGIVTTGEDFQNLLHRLLTFAVIPESVTREMEYDYSQAPVAPSGDGWFGHYSFGHWWECIGYGTPSERARLSKVCLDSRIQAGPGEFGWYPLLDRSGGGGSAGPSRQPYYFQVVLQEPDSLSGIPEYLRLVTKPLVDVILSGGTLSRVNRTALLQQNAGLLLRDITYIKSELQNCTCSGSSAMGEPFASLSVNLPADRPHLNRRSIQDMGIGILLTDVAEVQKKLGVCKCQGRERNF